MLGLEYGFNINHIKYILINHLSLSHQEIYFKKMNLLRGKKKIHIFNDLISQNNSLILMKL